MNGDKTELQAVEAQLRAAKEAAAAKDYFLSMLSHELRTPLTPALMLAANLSENVALPVEARRDAERIRRNIETQARLIDDLLDLTRIARGKLQLDLRPTDVHQVIQETLQMCQPEDGPPICLDLLAAQSLVHGDPSRLQQVLWNLLNNARKFTPANGHITVRTSNGKRPDTLHIGSDNSAGTLIVEIIDNGIGIEPALLSRIFESFEQGDTGQQRKGLGLGLAISKGIVEAHDGEIWADSAGTGQGARFVVELPVTQVLPGSMPSVSPRTLAAPVKSLRILLVEDHVATLEVLAKLLRNLGHEVHTAATVHDALEIAASHRIDLVISDLGLPDATGHDLMQQLRHRLDLRGIALSGYGMEGDVRKSRDAGFSEHLVKPVDLQKLEDAILRIVQD